MHIHTGTQNVTKDKYLGSSFCLSLSLSVSLCSLSVLSLCALSLISLCLLSLSALSGLPLLFAHAYVSQVWLTYI